MSDQKKTPEKMNDEGKELDPAKMPKPDGDGTTTAAPDFKKDKPAKPDDAGADMTPEAAKRRELEERIEAENQKLLAELQTGETRVLKRDGAAKITARKLLDELSGNPVIVRFCEYGNNPFKPVYLLMDERNIEVMQLGGGAVLAVNGIPCYVPGAKVIEDGEHPGYFKLV